MKTSVPVEGIPARQIVIEDEPLGDLQRERTLRQIELTVERTSSHSLCKDKGDPEYLQKANNNAHLVSSKLVRGRKN